MLDKKILELLSGFIKMSNDNTQFILVDDLVKMHFNDEELAVILEILAKNSIKIKEVFVVRENKPKPEEDFKSLEQYLDERFISSSIAFRKNRESGQLIPTIHLDQVLSLRLKESYLKHTILYLSHQDIYIRGIRLQQDEMLEETFAYADKGIKGV